MKKFIGILMLAWAILMIALGSCTILFNLMALQMPGTATIIRFLIGLGAAWLGVYLYRSGGGRL